MICSDTDPVEFVLVDEAVNVLWRGVSRPWHVSPDPTSGLTVHVLEFVPSSGIGRVHLEAGELTSHPFRVSADLCAPLPMEALGMFDQMRSGVTGHLGVPPNTGDTAVAGWSGSDARRLYGAWKFEGPID